MTQIDRSYQRLARYNRPDETIPEPIAPVAPVTDPDPDALAKAIDAHIGALMKAICSAPTCRACGPSGGAPVTIVEFLRQRLEDDEIFARNAYGDHNDAGPDWHEQWSGALNIGPGEDLINTNDSQVSRFMARFDPARILAEVEAKRAVLAVHRDDGDGYCVGCGFTADEERNYRVDECPTLLALARPYADHPDYRQEWGTPAMAAEITGFMAARLDTLERIARAATRGPWTVSDIAGDLGAADVRSPHGPVTSGRENPACSVEDAHHIAAHSPAYVLQDIEVKRRLLVEHAPSERPGRPVCRTCGDDDVDWPCRTLRILAYTWRDDPGWKQEWRP